MGIKKLKPVQNHRMWAKQKIGLEKCSHQKRKLVKGEGGQQT